MNLQLDTLDAIEAPLSDNFWIGFAGGVALVLLVTLVTKQMIAKKIIPSIQGLHLWKR